MKPRIKIKVTDRGLKRLDQLAILLTKNDYHVKVGVLDNGGKGSEVRDGGLSNAQIAAIHEFGSSDGKIPERSFLRAAFNSQKANWLLILRKLLADVILGKRTVEQSFNLLGLKMSSDVKAYITQGDPIPPPNAPSTARRKQRFHPGGPIRTLVDTGRMVASITWEFVRGVRS